ncbi:MAG: hypothetical protein ACR2QF_02225 [Geminicoccaceae bacterium]
MTHLAVRTEVAQAILNYLGTQPYGQVHQLIAELQQAQPVAPDEQAGPKLISDKSTDVS